MVTEKRLDLVEREAIKDAIGFMNLYFLGHGETKSVLDSVNEVPSVDAEKVVHGRWVVHSCGHGVYANNWVECSECGTCGSPQWKRCPVCEAKMDGERKDND